MATPRASDDFGPEVLARELRDLLDTWPTTSLVIALSGGADSAALLAAAAELARQHPGLSLRALHVDHGLAGSAALAVAAAQVAADLGVPFEQVAVTVAPAPGESLEAVAREVRHAAFARALAPGEALLTAHHREDQAETLLLQLLRGAGLPGLAAMPAAAPLGAGRLLRPLLAVSRASLRTFAAARPLPWVDDPMNDEARYDRVYLREAVWPALVARWPSAAVTLARSAGHAATAQRLLDRRSEALLAEVRRGVALSVEALLALSRAERDELLRYWLRQLGLPVPSSRRLAGIDAEILGARAHATPRLVWAGGELHRFDGRLYAFAPLPPAALPAGSRLPAGEGSVSLGSLGTLVARAGGAGGLAGDPARWRLGARQGGERLRLVAGGPSRPLKDWLREARLPPWSRSRAVLVRDEAEIAAVVLPHDTWVAAEHRASDGTGVALRWQGAPPVLYPASFIEP